MSIRSIAAAAALAVAIATLVQPAAAQELPPICTAGDQHMGMAGGMAGGMAMSGEAGAMMGAPDQAHADLMAGMASMNQLMAIGATAADIDVAFACSMIAHHQGAIAMARAELTHGDDPWVRALAQGIIDAQEKEIADMLDWLGRQPR